MRSLRLSSGQEMPILGLGTWDLRGPKCTEIVGKALDLGYRHIDTAWMYENQRQVGEGIRTSGVPYGEVFLTSKIWKTDLTYDRVIAQHGENLDQLGLDYVDLLLIHWPSDRGVPLDETLDAFCHLYEQGATRAIGISNFTSDLVDVAVERSRVKPVVNQIYCNLARPEDELRRHCQSKGVRVTAYTPLAKGAMSDNATVRSVASRYDKTPAQIMLKSLVEKDVIIIPKSGSERHLQENMDLFDWHLSDDDVQALYAIGSSL